MPSPLLHVASLSHAYGDRAVLSEVTLTVAPGELTAVLGSSGVGKSTLLRAVAGFVTPDRGTITLRGEPMLIDGREVTPAERRGVGMVFQDHALFPHMSAGENIAFGLDAWSPEERAARVKELLEVVGLSERGGALPGTLSGGQRQRIALARALAPKPDLLLLDEPFASLDTELRRDLADELRGILAREGVSALLVTHDHRAALAWCDQVAIMGAEGPEGPGRVHQQDRPEVVYGRPTTETAAKLTGEAILLDAHAQGTRATNALGAMELVEAREGSVRLVIRPEQLRFSEEDAGQTRVVARRFEGAFVTTELESPVGRLRIETPAQKAPAVGARGVVTTISPIWAL